MPRALHARQHRHHRPLQRLVDVDHALGDEARLQRHPQAEGDVGVLGGIFGGAVERDLIEAELRLAGAGDLLEGDRRVAEQLLGELVHAVAAEAAIERIGDEHGVVEGRHVDAVAGEDDANRI